MDEHMMTPPLNDEASEHKLIALAYRQAQKQLEDGTASSQIVTHFLRLGSERSKVEVEKLKRESLLIEEKILSEQTGQQMSEMLQEVLAALRSYTYVPPGEGDVDIY